MSDDKLRANKENAFDGAPDDLEPAALGCSNCGGQLSLSKNFSEHYGVDAQICTQCGSHWSNGKALN